MKVSGSLLIIVFLAGWFFSYAGFSSAIWLGSAWYKEKALQQWNMNSYYWLYGKDAFVFYGLIPMWLGGLFAGIAIPLTYTGKPKTTILIFFLAIICTALGFNTLDWMLSGVYGERPGWEAWVFNLNVKLEAWNFYILTAIVPLFVGGLFISMPLIYFALHGRIQ